MRTWQPIRCSYCGKEGIESGKKEIHHIAINHPEVIPDPVLDSILSGDGTTQAA